jgi:hypothetical protein
MATDHVGGGGKITQTMMRHGSRVRGYSARAKKVGMPRSKKAYGGFGPAGRAVRSASRR